MPTLAAAAFGVLAWLLAYGLVLLARAVAALLASALPGALAGVPAGIVNAANGALGAIAPQLDASIGGLTQAWDAIWSNATAWIGQQANFAESVSAALQRIVTHSIPSAIQTAVQQAEALIGAAGGILQGVVDGLRVELTAGLAELRSDLTGGLDVLGQQLGQGIATANGYAQSWGQYAVAVAQSLVAGLAAQLGGLIGQEAAQARSAESALGQAVGQLDARTQAELFAFEQTLGTEFGALATGVQSEVAQAKAELNREVAGFEQGVNDALDKILKGAPWAMVLSVYEGGEEAFKAAVLAQVYLLARQIRQEVKDAGAVRAKYAPQLQALLQQLRDLKSA